ncbi:PREDICTED: BRCA1-associated RING domain protein 1-like isoform X2 [Ceratosolen solmsi marchali]|uniref:BRCA1-associated RING domain protein 1-like isoform X2 n=1 Tax=Ceratosolen solmsi marchali TaxID=326594 RepID=A0AAJ7E136_9HYME|nr:PREDICTED: BRCA1-associated RING domain protein 1-like isoform X2 [Ceratosolen solmsi marchali]
MNVIQTYSKGQQEYVKYLLKAGADPNISCYANWTPLQESADYGFYEITKMLLESGANVNQPGYEGRTALHEAAKNNSYNMICLLLQYNAKKDIIDNNKKKPVYVEITI